MLLDQIDNIVPDWAKPRPHWWNFFRLAAVLVDSILEGVYQGRLAGLPNAADVPGFPAYGGFDDTSSLEYIGHDLGVARGLTESDVDYAFRLRNSQDASTGGWLAPNLFGVFEQLAGVLGPTPPLMRIVNRAGDWWTRNTDGTYVLQRVAGDGITYNADGTTTPNATNATSWDWDSTTDPHNADWAFPFEWWLIVYVPMDSPYGTMDDLTFNDPGVVGDEWNDPWTVSPELGPLAGCVGSNAPYSLVSLVLGVICQRQAAGFQCSHVIMAFDPTSFAPDGSSSAPAAGSTYPDGNWGQHTKYDSGTHSRIQARNSSAEYWLVPKG